MSRLQIAFTFFMGACTVAMVLTSALHFRLSLNNIWNVLMSGKSLFLSLLIFGLTTHIVSHTCTHTPNHPPTETKCSIWLFRCCCCLQLCSRPFHWQPPHEMALHISTYFHGPSQHILPSHHAPANHCTISIRSGRHGSHHCAYCGASRHLERRSVLFPHPRAPHR